MNKSLGEVFRSAWNTLQKNFKTIFVGILLYTLPTLIISWVSAGLGANAVNMGMFVGAGILPIISVLYMVFVSPLYMGYIVSVLRSYHLTGVPATFGTAWGAAKANYVRYLTTFLASIVISAAAMFIIFAVYMVVAMGALASSMGMFAGGYGTDPFSMLAPLIPAIIVLLVLMMLYIFCISFVQFIPGMEATSGFFAVFKSFKYIFKGNFWKSLGHVIVLGLITGAIQILIMLPWIVPYSTAIIQMSTGSISALTSGLDFIMGWAPVSSIIGAVVGIFVQCYSTPYMFEVYLNAKNVSDGKESQGVANMPNIEDFIQPNTQQPPQNWQPQQGGQIPPAPQQDSKTDQDQ